jgi:dTDP-4-amino-4,6-dideoxygalactose transaminase
VKVPLLDLKAQYDTIRPELEQAIRDVMESQHFILGPHVQKCEAAIARYCGSQHAIGVSSGSDALLICLMAEGIGPGDEVITTPYTFFATVGAITRLGATPVFVDIDPVTYNIDAGQIAAKVTARTKAIIPVHLYGQSADMQAVMAVAAAHHLVVIEDAAQAIGARYNGRGSGTIGEYGCLSFFPSKNLGAAGDGGMVITDDPARAEKLAILRAHGSKPKYYHRVVGGNFRLDALQGAIVASKLPHLDDWTEGRRRNAARYNRLFAESGLAVCDSETWAKSDRAATGPGAPHVVLPSEVTERHVFNQYVIRVSARDELKASLANSGIGTEVYYPVPMHTQECFRSLGHRVGDFPESEAAASHTLALPIYPELTDEQAAYVVASICEFFGRPAGEVTSAKDKQQPLFA